MVREYKTIRTLLSKIYINQFFQLNSLPPPPILCQLIRGLFAKLKSDPVSPSPHVGPKMQTKCKSFIFCHFEKPSVCQKFKNGEKMLNFLSLQKFEVFEENWIFLAHSAPTRCAAPCSHIQFYDELLAPPIKPAAAAAAVYFKSIHIL